MAVSQINQGCYTVNNNSWLSLFECLLALAQLSEIQNKIAIIRTATGIKLSVFKSQLSHLLLSDLGH